MPTELLRLDSKLLLATDLEFEVSEGPFRCLATELIKTSDEIYLHLKFPPLAMGGKLDKLKVSLQFWREGVLFYRVVLGRYTRQEMFAGQVEPVKTQTSYHWAVENTLDYEWLMWAWNDLEIGKNIALNKQFAIHKVTVVQQVVGEPRIIKVDTFSEMSDLEVLQKLNERSRQELETMRATSIAPILKKHGEAIPVDPNATIHIMRKVS